MKWLNKLIEKKLSESERIMELREKLIHALDRIVDLEFKLNKLEKETRHVQSK